MREGKKSGRARHGHEMSAPKQSEYGIRVMGNDGQQQVSGPRSEQGVQVRDGSVQKITARSGSGGHSFRD